MTVIPQGLLPVEPFARILKNEIETLRRKGTEDPVETCAFRSGISSKTISEIFEGRRTRLQFGTADKIVSGILGPDAWYWDEELEPLYDKVTPSIIEHGTRSMYTRNKCRCEPCRQANIEYMKKYSKRVREAA